MAFLDETGLAKLWEKIKAYVTANAGGASYAVGDIIITSTPDNPAARYGGEWECFDKHLQVAYYSSGDIFEPNTDYVSDYAIVVAAREHTLSIALSCTVVNTTLGDTNRSLGNVRWDRIGVTRMTNTQYNVNATDNTNGIVLTSLAYSSGLVTLVDTFPKGTATTLASGTEIRGKYECPVFASYMLDAFCDKFFWKKTA